MTQKLHNLKDSIVNHKNKLICAGTTALVTATPCLAFAADGDSSSSIDWTNAATTISNEFSNATGKLLPVGIAIFCGLLAIGFGPKIVKKLAK